MRFLKFCYFSFGNVRTKSEIIFLRTRRTCEQRTTWLIVALQHILKSVLWYIHWHQIFNSNTLNASVVKTHTEGNIFYDRLLHIDDKSCVVQPMKVQDLNVSSTRANSSALFYLCNSWANHNACLFFMRRLSDLSSFWCYLFYLLRWITTE